MKLGTKIGIVIAIIFLLLIGIAQIDVPTTPINKDKASNGNHKNPIKPSLAKKFTLGEFDVSVYYPIYTKTFYKDIGAPDFENYYAKYTAKDGFHFALIKVEATNFAKRRKLLSLYNIDLVTSEGLVYREHSFSKSSSDIIFTTPLPLYKEFSSLPKIVPRETRSGYLFFEIPTNTLPDHLRAGTWERSPLVKNYEITINLQPIK